MSKHKFYLSLGSNLGQRQDFLKKALRLMASSDKLELTRVSRVYETQPLGFSDQNDYLNLVVEGVCDMKPLELMDYLEDIESSVGRKAEFKNGPREIDIDILLFDDSVFEKDDLIIPHPGLNRREFALRPLLNLNPDLSEPTSNTPYAVYLSRISGQKKTVERTDLDFSEVLS
jgi:2-amino-4-hydroxy-6-hydroxymethyldihydropteridine diphosphokinase